jgi:SAM-dependent methyltransferase
VEHLLHATAAAEARHFWFRGFRAFVQPLVERATRDTARPRILDCGCGTGANVEWLGRYGDAYGFDLTMAGLRIGGARGQRRLARATVSQAPFPDRAFDLVTSFDVLYALARPIEQAAVLEMFRLTRPGGFVIVNVAAMDVLHGDHSILSHEVRRYSRASLSRLLTGAGFVVERITYTNASLFLPMLAVRLWQRWRGLPSEEHAQQDVQVPIAPVNLALTGLLKAESVWLRRLNCPFGSSLLCLARRPV